MVLKCPEKLVRLAIIKVIDTAIQTLAKEEQSLYQKVILLFSFVQL